MQGEGLYLGEPQIFVRFFGCNLSCKYCDTKVSRFTEYEPQELLDEILLYPSDAFHSISFTGGEPLLQKDFLKETLRSTHRHGYKNYLETNGTLPGELAEVIDDVDIVSMDIKLSGSVGRGHYLALHKKFLKIACSKEVFIKIVICDSTTESELREALEVVRGINRGVTIILQPNSFEDSAGLWMKIEGFREISASYGLTTCVIPQIQKVVGIK